MIEVLPKNIPILYTQTNYVDIFMNYLVEIGYIEKSRLLPSKKNQHYFIKNLYLSSEYPPCQNDCHRQYGPEFYGRMYKAFVPNELPYEKRDKIILIRRNGPRSISNHKELLSMLKKHGDVVGNIHLLNQIILVLIGKMEKI